MAKKTVKYIAIVLLCIGVSCAYMFSGHSAGFLPREQVYQKKIGKYRFTFIPYSSEVLTAINYQEQNLRTDSRDSIIDQYNEYICFRFEIDIDGFKGDISEFEEAGRTSDYDERVGYYLFGMQQSFRLIDDVGTETPCSVYYYERVNEIARTNRFIVGFKKTGKGGQVLQYSNPYFGCGKINVSINDEHLAIK